MKRAPYFVMSTVTYDDGTDHTWPQPGRYPNRAAACNAVRTYAPPGWVAETHDDDWSQARWTKPGQPQHSVTLNVVYDA